MDIDVDFVEFNRRKIAGTKYVSRMKILQGSIFSTNLPENEFDFVIARFVYQHIHNIESVKDPISKATLELKRILKIGGKLVATDSDHAYTDFVQPTCDYCNRVIEKQFQYRAEHAKSPISHSHSGTELYDYLNTGGLSNIRHETVFVSSKHFKDGIAKFLPMLSPLGAKNLVDLKFLSQRLMDKAMKEYEQCYITKKNGPPFMTILVFIACGEKTQNPAQNDEL
jgi:SAM-dependent methyltransferase